MLKALYDYSQQMGLALPAGYTKKTIHAFFRLTRTGQFAGLVLDGQNEFLCPDIGSLANGTDKSNLLVEKRSVVLPDTPSAKSQFFREGLRALSEQEPLAALCLQALEDPEISAAMAAALDQNKIKPQDRVSFLVDGTYLVEAPTVRAWWQTYRQQFRQTPAGGDTALCLITGQPTTPLVTVPKTTGLAVVGGHSSGDALICFDKPAFSSYGLKKSANAPVSEEAFAQVRAALDALLKDAPILAGMKFVHWYDRPLATPQADPVLPLFRKALAEDAETEAPTDAGPGDTLAAQQARREADALVRSVESGQPSPALPNRYYILLLSGASGRILVRQFTQGSYEELKANLDTWYADLQLVNRSGTGFLPAYSLTLRLIHLLKRQNSDKNVFDRLNKELPNLAAATVQAILQGHPLPDSVAARALSYIRSQILTEEASNPSLILPDPIACQWLKAWLIRSQKEADLMPEYNPQHPSPAYHLGAMVAVYAALQKDAYPDVNVTVVQRFFAAAQQTPALVLGRLAKLSVHHLAKLKYASVAQAYTQRLAQISTSIGDTIPTVLTLAEQSRFTLGYYQMTALLNREQQERRAQRLAANAEQNQEV